MRIPRWMAAGSLALALAVLPTMLKAEVYKWVDKNGTVHFTDNPEELPEPQRSEAIREMERKAAAEKEKDDPEDKPPGFKKYTKPDGQPHDRLPVVRSGSPTTAPSSSSSSPKAQKRMKKSWKTRMERAKQELAELEDRCEKLETEQGQAKQASLVYARPADRKRAKESSEALAKCQADRDKARHKVEVEIPEAAHKQGVPPGWLR